LILEKSRGWTALKESIPEVILVITLPFGQSSSDQVVDKKKNRVKIIIKIDFFTIYLLFNHNRIY